MKIVSVCYGLTPKSGGLLTSIRNFQEVFHGSTITFNNERDTCVQDLPGELVVIPCDNNFLGEKYGYTTSEKLKGATEILQKADLVIVHLLYRYHVDWAYRIATENNIPVWIIPHGGLDPYVFTYRSLQKKLWLMLSGSKFFRSASRVILSTTQELEKSKKWLQGSTPVVISWPVNKPKENLATPSQSLRERYGIDSGKRLLLWVGRLHPMKRPKEAIQIMSEMADSNLHLLIVGPDEVYSKKEMQLYADSLGCKNITLTGAMPTEEMSSLYSQCDAYLSNSYRENFGHAAAEALISGLPVILSSGNDLGIEIGEKDFHFGFVGDDLSATKDALRAYLALSPEKLTLVRLNAKRWAEENLSFETFRIRLQTLYKVTVEEAALKKPMA